GRCGHQLLSRPWQSSGRIGRAVSARSRRIRVQRLGKDTTPSGIREGGILPPPSVHRGLLSDKTDRRPPRSSAHALHTQGFSMPLFPRNSVHHTRLRLPCHPAHRSTTLGEHVPRLSHIFDITPVEREVVFETVDAAYAVARRCRFDGRAGLVLPGGGTRELLYSRAEELGIIDPETAGRVRRERHEAVERLQEGTLPPERAEELAISASTLALQLQSGNHLAPYSHYLVAELSPEGVPIEPADEDKGWSGTGLTITSWDEEATTSVDFAMPDSRGTQGPPVTSGTVVHDTATARLTGNMRMQIPGRGAWLR